MSLSGESGGLTEDLNRCLRWMWVNTLKLSPFKTEVLVANGKTAQVLIFLA